MKPKIADGGDFVSISLGLLEPDETKQLTLIEVDIHEYHRRMDNEWWRRIRLDPAQKARRYANAKRHRIRSQKAPVSDFDEAQWIAMQEKFEYRCAYCGKHSKSLEMEHILPLSRGGDHTRDNIVPACRKCNATKGARTPEEAGMAIRSKYC